MPIYTFECTNPECKEKFDKIVTKYRDEGKDYPEHHPACPKCNSTSSLADVTYNSNWMWGKEVGTWDIMNNPGGLADYNTKRKK